MNGVRQATIGMSPNWNSIQTLIPPTTSPPLSEYALAHESTIDKLFSAEFHYYNLNQVYRPDVTPRETDTQDWVRAELDSVVFSLYSAMDSLMNEINLAYGFGLSPGKANIYHEHRTFSGGCVRCALDRTADSLASYLNVQLSQQWFELFHKLRIQIVHRHVPIMNVHIRVSDPPSQSDSTTRIILPDDPSNPNPGPQDYSNDLDANLYLRQTCDHVRDFLEGAYAQLLPQVRTTYGL